MADVSAQACAERLVSVAPALMQALREDMRMGRGLGLSVPQFRTLVFFKRHPGSLLAGLAEHLGLSLPAASRLALALTERGFLARETSAADRRRRVVTLTPAGERLLAESRARAAAAFAKRLARFSVTEREVLLAVLGLLQRGFAPRSFAPTAFGPSEKPSPGVSSAAAGSASVGAPDGSAESPSAETADGAPAKSTRG